jgi:hypothetical protein
VCGISSLSPPICPLSLCLVSDRGSEREARELVSDSASEQLFEELSD